MNRRMICKGILSAFISYQLSPTYLFSKSNRAPESYKTRELRLFNSITNSINSGVVGWDFGTGMHNFQYHAFDVKNSHLYTLQHSTQNNEGGKISRFDMNNMGREQISIDAQKYDIKIGHQMLSVEHSISGVKLWAAKGLQESCAIIRFDYNPHGLASNIEEYIMFDPSLFGSFYITGNISLDQKWIILRGKSKRRGIYFGMNFMAIFDLKKVVNHGPGNVWHLAEYMWPYDYYQHNPKNLSINPQSVFSEGKYIFMLFGPLDINKPNLLRVYSFDGHILFQSPELKLGMNSNTQISTDMANEMEGAQIYQLSPSSKPVLTIGFVRGGPEYNKGIYIINNFPKFEDFIQQT